MDNISLDDLNGLHNVAHVIRSKMQSVGDLPISLYNGTMGNAIFLYNYGYLIENEEVIYYADSLIQEILYRLSSVMEDSFKTGLLGIGWGLAYLNSMDFIDTSKATYSLVEDVCCRTMLHSNMSLGDGSTGYIVFLLERLINNYYLLPSSERIREIRKHVAIINYVDEIEKLRLSYYKKWELSSIDDVINFFKIDLKFFATFVQDFCDCSKCLCIILDKNIYKEITFIEIKTFKKDLTTILKLLLDNKNKFNNDDNHQVIIYVSMIMNIITALSMIHSRKYFTEDFNTELESAMSFIDQLLGLNKQVKIDSFSCKILQSLIRINIELRRSDIKSLINTFKTVIASDYQNCSTDLVGGLAGYGIILMEESEKKHIIWNKYLEL